MFRLWKYKTAFVFRHAAMAEEPPVEPSVPKGIINGGEPRAVLSSSDAVGTPRLDRSRTKESALNYRMGGVLNTLEAQTTLSGQPEPAKDEDVAPTGTAGDVPSRAELDARLEAVESRTDARLAAVQSEMRMGFGDIRSELRIISDKLSSFTDKQGSFAQDLKDTKADFARGLGDAKADFIQELKNTRADFIQELRESRTEQRAANRTQIVTIITTAIVLLFGISGLVLTDRANILSGMQLVTGLFESQHQGAREPASIRGTLAPTEQPAPAQIAPVPSQTAIPAPAQSTPNSGK